MKQLDIVKVKSISAEYSVLSGLEISEKAKHMLTATLAGNHKNFRVERLNIPVREKKRRNLKEKSEMRRWMTEAEWRTFKRKITETVEEVVDIKDIGGKTRRPPLK